MNVIRVVIADDHPVVRRGIASMLSTYEGIQVVGDAFDSFSTLEVLSTVHPDILLLDLKMPGGDGMSLIRQVKQQYPEIKIIVLTVFDGEDFVCGAIEAGVHAYILKSIAHEELFRAIVSVYSGEMMVDQPLVGKVLNKYADIVRENQQRINGLTEEETMLLNLASRGMKNKDIAEKCYWSEITVKHKFRVIYQKLEVSDRTQAVATAIRKGLI